MSDGYGLTLFSGAQGPQKNTQLLSVCQIDTISLFKDSQQKIHGPARDIESSTQDPVCLGEVPAGKD